MKDLKQGILTLLFLLLTISIHSQILQVPSEYSTIQAAINIANERDTVLVDTGRYYENINFRGKNIVVASKYILGKDTSYISRTIIDGSKPVCIDSASCVMFYQPGDSLAMLEGFTLTGGTGSLIYVPEYNITLKEGGGVLLAYSKATIKNNIIDSNHISNDGGGGIASFFGKPNILNNIIMNNTSGYAAGLVLNWSDGVVKNNIIYHNKKIGSSWLTGGLMVWNSPGNPIVENNTIVGNYSFTEVGGISVTSASAPIIRNNIIWGNRQKYGSQVKGVSSDNMEYCNLEEFVAGEGNISSFPGFSFHKFTLGAGSPCIDAGSDSIIYNDTEDTLLSGQALAPSKGYLRNDMGAYGGSGATPLNYFHAEDLYVVAAVNFGSYKINDSIKKEIEILNPGTSSVIIDSITISHNDLSIEKGFSNDTLNSLKSDIIYVNWNPETAGEFMDTLRIYHSVKSIENPQKIVLYGEAKALPDTTTTSPPITSVSNSDFLKLNTENKLTITPNTFAYNSLIRYHVENKSFIDISVFNMQGRKVRTLISNIAISGDYEYSFHRQDLNNGVYIIRYMSDKEIATKRFLIK